MILFVVAVVVLLFGIIGAIVAFSNVDTGAGIASIVVSIFIAVVLILMSCATIVPTGHTGVLTTFGEVEDRTLDSGMNFTKPWQRVINMDNRVQKQTINLSCFSSDIQEVTMVYTINYQINKENAQNIYKTVGKDYYNTVITPCVTESTKVVTAKYSAEALVSERAALAAAIEKELTEKLAAYDIILVDASIEDMDFTVTYTNAVEEKQVAQQNKLRAETEAEKAKIEAEAAAEVKRINAQAEADAKLIEAEAEAEANSKLAESLNDNVLSNKWIATWNGEMPMVVGADGNLINIPIG
jgi:regulator of protease activity HflC (stomatin/prohibitin superfamily)